MPSYKRSRKTSNKRSRKISRKTSRKSSRGLKLIKIVKSPRHEKKLRAYFSDGTHTDFGASGYSDFTMHKDPERRDRYDSRHKRREDWKNPKTAGSLSKWVLWNKPSLKASISDYKRRFNL
jgi:hypothetical protein